jgi:hypothetical protein
MYKWMYILYAKNVKEGMFHNCFLINWLVNSTVQEQKTSRTLSLAINYEPCKEE